MNIDICTHAPFFLRQNNKYAHTKYKNKTIKKIPYIYYKIRDYIYIYYMFTILYNFKDDIIFVLFALKKNKITCAGIKTKDDLCDRTGFCRDGQNIFKFKFP